MLRWVHCGSHVRKLCGAASEGELAKSIASRLVRVSDAVKEARSAAALASDADSDDVEREMAVARGKYAIKAYDDLLRDAGEQADVVRERMGEDVGAMKEELFSSRKQRVWIGWSGWF